MKQSYIEYQPPLWRRTGFFVFLAFTGLLLICLSTACSNDPEDDPGSGGNGSSGTGIEEPVYPPVACSKIQLMENSRREAGVPTVTTTRTYLYDEGRLVSASTVQRFTAVEPQEIELRTTVGYNDRLAVVDNESDTIAVYMLNDNGYAQSCELREGSMIRKYTFGYLTASDGSCYLNRLTESLREEETAEIRIEYEDARIVRVIQRTQSGGYEQEYTVDAAPEIANPAGIPSLFLAEMYPLSFHSEALYGRLLGESARYLLSRIVPVSGDETITYTYKTDGQGFVTSCRECINSYGTDYVRTVNYVIE